MAARRPKLWWGRYLAISSPFLCAQHARLSHQPQALNGVSISRSDFQVSATPSKQSPDRHSPIWPLGLNRWPSAASAPVRKFLIDWIENCLMTKFWVGLVSECIVRATMKSASTGRNGLPEAQQDCARSFSESAVADVLSPGIEGFDRNRCSICLKISKALAVLVAFVLLGSAVFAQTPAGQTPIPPWSRNNAGNHDSAISLENDAYLKAIDLID